MARSRVPERPLALRVVLYFMGGVLFGAFVCVMKPDISWTAAAFLGLAFAVFYGVIFDAWYRHRIFQQDLEGDQR
jgi:membrane associated rhomboid family serine protease